MGSGPHSPRVTSVLVDDMITVIGQYKGLLLVDLSEEAAMSKYAEFVQALGRVDDGVLMRWTIIAFSADLLSYLNRNNLTRRDYNAWLKEENLATLHDKLATEKDLFSIFSLIVPYLERLNFTWQTVNDQRVGKPRSRAPVTEMPLGFKFAVRDGSDTSQSAGPTGLPSSSLR